MQQLPLGVQLEVSSRFETFRAGTNLAVIEDLRALRRAPGQPPLWLCGAEGTGKTHLLQAACARLSEGGSSVAYVPLQRCASLGPGLLAGYEHLDAVLVDDLGLASAGHWKVYLAVFVASIAGMLPLVLATERTRRGPALLVLGILLAAVSQAMLGGAHGHFWVVMAALTLFFAAFNYLEARLPALLTLAAPGAERGAALGIFATAQFLGAFAGGSLGGVLLGRYGLPGVFWGAAAVAALWALFAASGTTGTAKAAEHA